MDNFNAQEFGNRVKNLRGQRGLTQKELSVQADILLSVIQRCEAGKLYRGTDAILKLAKFFNVTIDFLLMG